MNKSTQSNLRKVLVGLALVLGCITGYLTYNAYISKFGAYSTEDYLIAGGIGFVSAVVQAVFVYLIPRISYGPIKYGMVLVCLVITAFTVYGMDMKVTQGTLNNIINSVSYQLKLKTAESYLKAADIQQQYDKATRSEKNINRASEITKELDKDVETGRGSVNTRSDYENKEAGFDSAFWWKKAAGALVDMMYYLVLWLIYFGVVIASGKTWDDILPEENKKVVSSTPKKEKQEEETQFSRNGGNGQVEKKNSGLSSKAGVEGKKKKMERNLAKLERYLETHEYTTQRKMAEYLGVSTETIRKYLSILEERGYLEQQTLHN